TVIALETGKLLTVAEDDFRHFLKTRPPLMETLLSAAHRRLLEYTLRPLFRSGNDCDLPWLSRIVEVFQIRHFSTQELIIKEGERNQTLYVILDGQLQVSCQGHDATNEIPIITLNAGDFFGEFSLLTGEAASAAVRTLSAGWMASLKRREIDRLAAHFPGFLPRILKSFRARKQDLIKKKINSLNPDKPRQLSRGNG
ncbi:MAG: cyclic nucleotide-binding domain-containing protein, partial [Pseudomonadota bacterium]|nr:cyclic nucleotide-binding domain-containing protein [Pseudomonadota bacterium]